MMSVFSAKGKFHHIYISLSGYDPIDIDAKEKPEVGKDRMMIKLPASA